MQPQCYFSELQPSDAFWKAPYCRCNPIGFNWSTAWFKYCSLGGSTFESGFRLMFALNADLFWKTRSCVVYFEWFMLSQCWLVAGTMFSRRKLWNFKALLNIINIMGRVSNCSQLECKVDGVTSDWAIPKCMEFNKWWILHLEQGNPGFVYR